MLTQVSAAAAKAARVMTIRHPNSLDVQVWRKKMLRTDAQYSGKATIGGAMLLTDEDESQYAKEAVGDAKLLWLGRDMGSEFAAESGLTFNPEQVLVQAYIECPLDATDAKFFTAQKDDLIFWAQPEFDFVLGWQVKAVRSPTQLPRHLNVYDLQPYEHGATLGAMP